MQRQREHGIPVRQGGEDVKLVTAMAIILASYPVTAGINRLLADRSAAQER
jgi:hypothetical protein